MSISKQQAAALADGFLDGLGSDKDGFRPAETVSEVFLLAGELIEDAQNNLIKSKNIASGALSESLIAENPVQNGSIIRVDIKMLYYGRFVNKGVKGTVSGSGLYQFRNSFPSKKHVKAISEWMKDARTKVRTVKKYKKYGRHEKKTQSVSELSNAYAIARSIKMKGLKANHFLDKAVKTAQDKARDRFGAALKIDIINSLR